MIPIHYKESIGQEYEWLTDFISDDLGPEWRKLNQRLWLLGQPYATISDFIDFMQKSTSKPKNVPKYVPKK